MAREAFEIRFDRHGHIVIEDPELKRRIRCLLEHDHQIVLRMSGDEQSTDAALPNNKPCLMTAPPIGDRPTARNEGCPNDICDGGWLKVVNESRFEALINPPRLRPEVR